MTDICLKCGAGSDVINSRPRGKTRMRRRQCGCCGHRWSTIEVSVDGEYEAALERVIALAGVVDQVSESFGPPAEVARNVEALTRTVAAIVSVGDLATALEEAREGLILMRDREKDARG